MRWVLLLLIIPSVFGMGIGASPPVIELQDGEGRFLLVNPNNESVVFSVASDLDIEPRHGELAGFEERYLTVYGKYDGNITVTFVSDDLLYPALFLSVIGAERNSYFWEIVAVLFGCLIVWLFVQLIRFYLQ